jgi:putative phosphoesterase
VASQETYAFNKLYGGQAKTIGIISDTHVPDRAKKIPEKVFQTFENVDFIVHAGDLVEFSVIEELKRLAPVFAVSGNMDRPEIRGKLPRLDFLKVFDWKIGVTHNPGALFGRGRMRAIARTNRFDALVYGHTHGPNVKWEERILFINPGSPTDPTPPFLTKPTVALLRVTKERITPQIVRICPDNV